MTKTEKAIGEIRTEVARLTIMVKVLGGLVVISLSGHPVPLALAKFLLP